jgi:hypothetical protein
MSHTFDETSSPRGQAETEIFYETLRSVITAVDRCLSKGMEYGAILVEKKSGVAHGDRASERPSGMLVHT